MYENALEIIKKLNDSGFPSYIVGGYPRNKYLGIMETDIDLCTMATPEDIASLFSNVDMTNALYGSVHLKYSGYLYEVTTFRCDKSMMDGNRFYDIDYVETLEEDLLRRDFIMNTLCIDYNGQYVDCLGAKKDIDNRIIRTVKNPYNSFKEDPLRMLRAIRFSTILSFELSEEICLALTDLKFLLSKLSFYRIKKELDLIFASQNCMTGISLLMKFEMGDILGLSLDNVEYCSDYLGIWSQICFSKNYPFTKKEKDAIDKICYLLTVTPSCIVVYQYGIDICKLVDEIHKNRFYQALYEEMPIHSREEIDIEKEFIYMNVPTHLISTMYKKIETEILFGNLINEKKYIESFILENI